MIKQVSKIIHSFSLTTVIDQEHQRFLNRVTGQWRDAFCCKGLASCPNLTAGSQRIGHLEVYQDGEEMQRTRVDGKLGAKLKCRKSTLTPKFRGSEKCRNKQRALKGLLEGGKSAWNSFSLMMAPAWSSVEGEQILHFHSRYSLQKNGLVSFSFATYRMSCSKLVKSGKSIRHRMVVFLCSESGNHATPTYAV